MILEIKGLPLPHSRSPSDIKSVLMDTFSLGSKDILFTDSRNNLIQCEVLNERIEQKMLSQNGRKLRDFNTTLTVRKLKHNIYSISKPKNSYSDTLFKINKIPINWDISDVVKYFSVSCNAPLRTCYRLNQDNENIHHQYVFVEFISSDCAIKARNILERSQNCLGIIPIQTKNISKILQYYPSYIAPKNVSFNASHSHSYSRKLPIDNNGGSRAYGTHNITNKTHKRHHGHGHKKSNRNKWKKDKRNYTHSHNNNYKRGSSLNGHRIKRQLELNRNKELKKRKYFKDKNINNKRNKQRYYDYDDSSYNIKNREMQNSNSNSTKILPCKDKNKSGNKSDCSHSSCSTSSNGSDSYCSSYSYSSSDDANDVDDHETGTVTTNGSPPEEGEILKKKLRHITSKSFSDRNKLKKNMNNSHSPKSPSASIASFSASPTPAPVPVPVPVSVPSELKPRPIILNSTSDVLRICGIDITNVSEIKELTIKIEHASEFMYASKMSDNEIIEIWNDIIGFFQRNPKHYIIHFEYVWNLIVSLIRLHGYILPLVIFIKLPIIFLLEICNGNAIKIIEEFLSIKYQRFHQQFQNILINNIDTIKLAFKKLCKSSLYNIVQIIDKKNYKQLSKELIPIIRNRTNNNNDMQLENNFNYSSSLSPISCDSLPYSQSYPPPPPPKKPISQSLLAMEFESNGCVNNNNKREIDIIYPPRKKPKTEYSKKPVDPRVNRINNCMKIVYKKRKNCENMEYFEFNIDVINIIKNVENCVGKMVKNDEIKNGSNDKKVMDLFQSLSETFRNKYKLDKYLNDINNKCDMTFYENIFDIMNIVFKIPNAIYTIINMNEKDKKNILYKLRNICSEEIVLFINMNDNKYTFCVCSQRLGIVSINCDFGEIFEGLIISGVNDMNGFDNECMNDFIKIYDLWKKGGVNVACIPKNNGGNMYVWVNGVIAYLYLVLDICRIDYNTILNKYLNDVMNISFDKWSYLLPMRILNFLFENIKQMEKMGGIENVKPNFYRELPMINGH